MDAHFECKDLDSHLAEPFNRQEDRVLRKYLNHLSESRPSEIWIGALFNYQRNKWQWGHSGLTIKYQSFSQMSANNKDLKFHCAILQPNLKYRWSASSCYQEHKFICQHRMPFVNEKNRQKIYNKWNETYPNEMANEIEIVMSEDDLSRRRRRLQHTQLRAAQKNNRQTKDGSYRQQNDIHFNNVPHRDQSKYPTRKARMGGNRQQNNHGVRRQFELNRNRASGMRERIQFNDMTTNNTNNRRFNGRVPNLTTTISPSTVWSSTSWTTPKAIITSSASAVTSPIETTTRMSSNVISNDVTHYSDNMSQHRNDEIERLHHDEKLRIKTADHLWHMEQERIMEQRQHDLNERRQKEATKKEQEQQSDMQTNLLRREQHQNERANDERAVQTNEIFAGTVSTTARSSKSKKLKNKTLHERFNKLSPEKKVLFIQLRAEKHRKRAN